MPHTGLGFLRDSLSRRKDSTLSSQYLQSNEGIESKFFYPKVALEKYHMDSSNRKGDQSSKDIETMGRGIWKWGVGRGGE